MKNKFLSVLPYCVGAVLAIVCATVPGCNTTTAKIYPVPAPAQAAINSKVAAHVGQATADLSETPPAVPAAKANLAAVAAALPAPKAADAATAKAISDAFRRGDNAEGNRLAQVAIAALQGDNAKLAEQNAASAAQLTEEREKYNARVISEVARKLMWASLICFSIAVIATAIPIVLGGGFAGLLPGLKAGAVFYCFGTLFYGLSWLTSQTWFMPALWTTLGIGALAAIAHLYFQHQKGQAMAALKKIVPVVDDLYENATGEAATVVEGLLGKLSTEMSAAEKAVVHWVRGILKLDTPPASPAPAASTPAPSVPAI